VLSKVHPALTGKAVGKLAAP